MDKLTLGLLASTTLFKHMSMEDLAPLLTPDHYHIRQYGKGELIHLQGEHCHSLDLILSGRVTIQRIDPDGRILTIRTFSEGDDFGGNMLFSSHNQYPMTLTAQMPATLVHFTKPFVRQACQVSAAFMDAFLQSVSDKVLILTGKIHLLTLPSIRDQLLDYIQFQQQAQGQETIRLTLTKTALAERFGISRTSLSRELQKMKRDGLIQYDRNTITLL